MEPETEMEVSTRFFACLRADVSRDSYGARNVKYFDTYEAAYDHGVELAKAANLLHNVRESIIVVNKETVVKFPNTEEEPF